MPLFGGPKKVKRIKDLSNIWAKDKQLIKDIRQAVGRLDLKMEEQLIALLLESIERASADVSALDNRGRKLAAEDFLSRSMNKINGIYIKLA